MIGGVLPRQLVLPLMLCPLLRSRRGIFALTHTALFVKISLSWVLKQGRCHVTIYITQTVLFLGWFSTTHALFVARSCLHKFLVMFVVNKVQMVETGAAGVRTGAAAMAVVPVAARMVGRVREGGTCSRLCGLLARQTQMLIIMMKQEEAAQEPPMERIMRWITLDGLLITEVLLVLCLLYFLCCVPLQFTSYLQIKNSDMVDGEVVSEELGFMLILNLLLKGY